MNVEKLSSNINDLLDAIKSKDSETRTKAAELLGSQNDARAVDALIKALKDRTVQVRIAAASALRHFKNEKVAKALVQALDDHNEKVAEEAVNSLVELGHLSIQAIEPLFGKKATATAQAKRHAVTVLGKISGNYSNTILRRVLDDGQLGESAARYLVARSETDPIAILSKTEEKVQLRLAAAEILGEEGNEQAIDALLLAIRTPSNPHVLRVACIRILKRHKKKQFVIPLISILVDGSESVDIKTAVIDALTTLGNKRTVEPLIELLSSPNLASRVKVAIIHALAILGDNSSIKPILPFLECPDPSIRERTAYTLGVLKAIEAIEPLGKALQDNYCYKRREIQRAGLRIMDEWEKLEYPVRVTAANALKAIGTPRAIQLLEQNKKYLEIEIIY